MAYGEAAQSTGGAPQVQSLLADSTHIVERLGTLYNHLIDLGNRLHGSQPRDVAAPSAKIEPEPTVRRNLDKAGSWLSDLENELQRISAKL
jgi:hypothetical protein